MYGASTSTQNDPGVKHDMGTEPGGKKQELQRIINNPDTLSGTQLATTSIYYSKYSFVMQHWEFSSARTHDAVRGTALYSR